MPQVAPAPAIPPQRPEPSARAAASDEASGTFGGMLDASAGAGSSQPADADGRQAAPDAKDAGAGSAQAKLAGAPTATAATQAQSDRAPDGGAAGLDAVSPLLTVDLAILAQAASTGPVANPSPGVNPKADEADTTAVKADAASPDKVDGSDDAPASPTTPDAKPLAIAMPIIVATAVPSAPPADIAAATSGDGASGVPSITSQASASTSINNEPPKATAQAAAVTSSDTLAPAPEGDITPAEIAPQIKAAAAATADAATAPAETATADQPAKPGEAKSGDAKSADVPPPEAKSAARPDRQIEKLTAESGKTDSTKLETAKAKDPSHADAKPAQAHASADEVRATGRAIKQDSEAPGDEAHAAARAAEPHSEAPAPQPHGQPSEHAPATARTAFGAAHSDLSAPTSVAPAATASIGTNPAAPGLNLATPLASPLQSLWQAPAQRADSSDNAVPIAGVAIEIVSRAQEGLRRFEIRLDPPELGRIDVRLDVDRGGNVTSRLTADRVETLDLLRRDAPQLERALQHAGLNTEGGLQFSLRDQNFANRQQPQHNATTLIVPDDEPAAAEAARRGYGRLIGLGGGIDIRV